MTSKATCCEAIRAVNTRSCLEPVLEVANGAVSNCQKAQELAILINVCNLQALGSSSVENEWAVAL